MSDLNEIVAASHTTAGVVAVLARQASEIVSKPSKGDYPDAGPYLILRNADGSERIEALTITQQPPARKTGLLTLLDRRSFIDYIKLHGIATPIYARIDPRLAQTDKERGEISAGGQNTRFNSITIDGVNDFLPANLLDDDALDTQTNCGVGIS